MRELKGKGSDLDTTRILVRRQLLPKNLLNLADLATSTPIGTDLDVKLPMPDQFYSWNDFNIGAEFNVLGRKFVIYDVDGFTRNFYAGQGVKLRDALPNQQLEAQKAIIAVPVREEEANLLFKHVPEKRVKNLSTVLECENKVMSFSASITNSRVAYDAERKFVISLRLTDDMITIYEPSSRFAGMIGGKMADRVFAVNPQTKQYFKPSDFYIGGKVFVSWFCGFKQILCM